jgi:hypothetical protein
MTDLAWNNCGISVTEGDLCIFAVTNTSTSSTGWGFRPKGNTANTRTDVMYRNCTDMAFCFAGTDGDVEFYCRADAVQEVYHIATIDAADCEQVMDASTDATDLGAMSNGWNTIALSPTATNPPVALIEAVSTTSATGIGYRHPSRTDTISQHNVWHNHGYFLAHLDSSDNIELYCETGANITYYLVGFITAGYTPYETASQAARNDVGEAVQTDTWFVRNDDLTHDYYNRPNREWGNLIVEGDGSSPRQVEVKSTDVSENSLYLFGTFDDDAAPAATTTILRHMQQYHG